MELFENVSKSGKVTLKKDDVIVQGEEVGDDFMDLILESGCSLKSTHEDD